MAPWPTDIVQAIIVQAIIVQAIIVQQVDTLFEDTEELRVSKLTIVGLMSFLKARLHTIAFPLLLT